MSRDPLTPSNQHADLLQTPMALARTGGQWGRMVWLPLVTGLFPSLVSFVFSKSALGAVFFEDMSGTETVSGRLLEILHITRFAACALSVYGVLGSRCGDWRKVYDRKTSRLNLLISSSLPACLGSGGGALEF